MSPGRQGERTDVTSGPGDQKSSPETRKRLRAILRAPAEVQGWYREGLISQKDAWAAELLAEVRAPARPGGRV